MITTRIHHILSKTPLLVRVVSLYVLAGPLLTYFLLPLAPSHPVHADTKRVAVHTPPIQQPTKPQEVSGQPVQIELPRIELTRNVIAGEYDTNTGQWTLTDDSTQYATMTPPANNHTGQTLIYGHNTPVVLEPVRLVQPGDTLLVTLDNGHVLAYTYSHDRIVQPTDTSVLYETSATSRLVLMTCEGVLSDTRRLLYFDFKEVQS